ncbi:MAG: 3-hydroxyacyl-CoA dehydrogenase, partial [Oligoflexia bacterium]|nr:3-hydroxyacyl-CoA dehydrogenase [Oligoflexia bacterium]
TVVIRDIRQQALDSAMARARQQANKQLRFLSAEARQAVLDRIHPTLDLEHVAGSDLVIEAVVEDLKIKQHVIAQVEPLLAPDAIFASNTSALPISQLAEHSIAPDRFIGLHYFSPVEQMPLVEIVRGQATSDRTVARALAFARQTHKTPIVVNDGYGFYTTRVFSAYLLEGAQLVAEGHDPRLVEWGARQAGMVVGPLQVFDEVTLSLGCHVLEEAQRYVGDAVDITGTRLVLAMVAQGRLGKAHGAGFYDYSDGRRTGLWAGLPEVVAAVGLPSVNGGTATADPVGQTRSLGRRLLLAQCAEVARRIDQGVIQRNRDAEVGAVFGIGFAPCTGGPLAFMDRVGLPALVAELDQLATTCGARFQPAPLLRKMAEDGQRFFE